MPEANDGQPTPHPPPPPPRSPASPGVVDADPAALDSRLLFRGRQEVQIRHDGEVYRLRVTRNGRLILNK